MEKTLFPQVPILVVDDEPHFLKSVQFILKLEGINNAVFCGDSRQVMGLLKEQRFSLILLDLLMPHLTGFELLPEINAAYPDIPVVIITAENRIEKAVECIKKGASDFIVKPVNESRLLITVKNFIRLSEIQNENRSLKRHFTSAQLDNPEAFDEIVTRNPKMFSLFQYIEAIASTSLPILITGETGTGKELMARAVHLAAGRKGKFTALNIAGEDKSMVSDTLFGHSKGGFTGAITPRKGLIETATGGTMFLDEIGDLSAEIQTKLLRLLQEKKYYPIGSDIEKSTDARFVFATNRDMMEMMEAGTFRRDLYYRLQSHHIHIPALRERIDDIPLLLEHFLEKGAELMNKTVPTPPDELINLLRNYHFPGNIRELEGMVMDAVGRHTRGVLSSQSFRDKIEKSGGGTPMPNDALEISPDKSVTFHGPMPTLKEMERFLVNKALETANNNQTIAARLLGISRKALNNRLIRGKAGGEDES